MESIGMTTSRAGLDFDWRATLRERKERANSLEEHEQHKADWYNAEVGNLEGYDCQVCKNKGYVASVVKGLMTLTPCECMPIRASVSRLKRSGLENVVKEYTFKRYKADEPWQMDILKKAVEYAKNPEGWFYIGGQVGAGKTHICTAIAVHLLKQGLETYYMLWTDATVELKANKCDDEEYNKLMGKLKSVDVLYIDDFLKTEQGKQPTTADINIAFELLNNRYNAKKITIVSSEKTLKEVLNIDEALGSRIKQRAGENDIAIAKDGRKNYRLR